MNSYVSYDNLIPLIAPIDTVATAISTPFVDLKAAHKLAFLVEFGSVTSGTADTVITMTVECATSAASTSGTAMAFDYRLSGAVGANTWGDVTAATSAGYAPVVGDLTGKTVWIEVDPSAVAAVKADARVVKLEITPTDATACVVGVVGILQARYKQPSPVSAT
jgi:hypothetical protein